MEGAIFMAQTLQMVLRDQDKHTFRSSCLVYFALQQGVSHRNRFGFFLVHLPEVSSLRVFLIAIGPAKQLVSFFGLPKEGPPF